MTIMELGDSYLPIALLKTVEDTFGAESAAFKWTKEQLEAGHKPQAVATAMLEMMDGPPIETEISENGHVISVQTKGKSNEQD